MPNPDLWRPGRFRRGRHVLTRRRAGALSVLGLIATLLLTTTATARPPAEPRQLTPADFRPIVLPPLPSPLTPDADDASAKSVEAFEAIQDFAAQPTIAAPRPTPAQRASARSLAKAPVVSKAKQRVFASPATVPPGRRPGTARRA
jgi:hypothetical protein